MKIDRKKIICSKCFTEVKKEKRCKNCGRTALVSFADLILTKNENQEKLAFKLYLQSAIEDNDSYALFCVGHCYEFGIGVAIDIQKAKEYYIKAQDTVEGLLALGDLYSKEKNLLEVFSYYKKAYEVDKEIASYRLALFQYENKEIASPYNTYELFKISSKSGFNKATFMMGMCLYNGIGIDINYNEAFNVFQKLYDSDNKYGSYGLGLCYYNGNGCIKDYNIAFKLFTEAKNSLIKETYYYLGLCYLNGQGTEIDEEKSKKYFELYNK